MIKIALTGNIASGKSEVQKILSEKGYKVIDTDQIAHELLNSDIIKNAFNNCDIFENGEISRTKLGKIIFSDKKNKEKLEQIIHPLIKEKILYYFDLYSDEKCVFVGIPLLFEAGMTELFDKIVLVYADDTLRLQRLIQRNGYSEDYAKIRMNCQISQDEKINKVDIVVYNNSTFENLKNEIFTKVL